MERKLLQNIYSEKKRVMNISNIQGQRHSKKPDYIIEEQGNND